MTTFFDGESITIMPFVFFAPVEDNPVDDEGSADRVVLLFNSWLFVERLLQQTNLILHQFLSYYQEM